MLVATTSLIGGNMIRLAYVAISSICLSTLIATAPLFAQPLRSAPLVYSSDPAIDKIVRSYSLNSSDDPSIVPVSSYYRFIFTNIQQRIPDYVTPADWEIISQLPSHFDRQFMEGNFRDIETACDALSETTPLDGVIAVAKMVDDAESNLMDKLERHYREVLAKLSPRTQTEIEKERVRLSGTKTIGYATYNMTGLAAELPAVAHKQLLNGCKAIEANREKLSQFKDEKLINVEPRLVN